MERFGGKPFVTIRVYLILLPRKIVTTSTKGYSQNIVDRQNRMQIVGTTSVLHFSIRFIDLVYIFLAVFRNSIPHLTDFQQDFLELG